MPVHSLTKEEKGWILECLPDFYAARRNKKLVSFREDMFARLKEKFLSLYPSDFAEAYCRLHPNKCEKSDIQKGWDAKCDKVCHSRTTDLLRSLTFFLSPQSMNWFFYNNTRPSKPKPRAALPLARPKQMRPACRSQYFSKIYYKELELGEKVKEAIAASGLTGDDLSKNLINICNKVAASAWNLATPEQKEAVKSVRTKDLEEMRQRRNSPTNEQRKE